MKAKSEIYELIKNAGFIPVFYHGNIEVCKNVIEACYHGGVRVFEYTNRGEAASSNFPKLKEFVAMEFPDMILGIGSIINQNQAKEFIQLGADFIVSPITDKDTGDFCIENELFWIPGCATPTEIVQAENYGAEIIKIFPGSVLGPEFVKAVLGPMPWLKLLPAGGVEPTVENLSAWFKAGVICVGMGSQLITKEIIQNDNYDLLTEKVKETFAIIEGVKS